MADDGGSTGVLRRQFGMLPPGDIRNCLVAMAEDPEGPLARVFQYRFPQGEGLAGHALGNLIIAALNDLTGSFPEAIEQAGAYLNVRGRVLPSTLEDVVLHAIDRNGDPVSGQARIANNPIAVARVSMAPADPPAYALALDAIRKADLIVYGPGSLFTSIIPNFLVAGLTEAVCTAAATRIYICNVANLRGETFGFDAGDHVEALVEHACADAVDVALVHVPDKIGYQPTTVQPVAAPRASLDRIRDLGVDVVTADLVDPMDPVRHSRLALCSTLRAVVG
jgi:uncharacterized cofD-like protein